MAIEITQELKQKILLEAERRLKAGNDFPISQEDIKDYVKVLEKLVKEEQLILE